MSVLLPLLTLLPMMVLGGEPPAIALGPHAHSLEQETLRGVADKRMNDQLTAATLDTNSNIDKSEMTYPTYFNFTDSSGELLASMLLGQKVTIDLANTICKGIVVDGKCCSGKGASKCDTPGKTVPDMTSIVSFPLDGVLTPTASSKGENYTEVLTLSIKFSALTTNMTGLTLTAAELVLTVATAGIVRPDYWNLTLATLSLTGSMNGTDLPAYSDVTPKSGYTWAQPACTAPYSICAPIGLSWSCTDQVLAPTTAVINNISLGSKTVMVHLPDLVLQLGNSTEEQYTWDCDPLIPISVWVSVLVTLFLASILLWGLYMLATLQSPTKFDDPKGPSIHVPTAE